MHNFRYTNLAENLPFFMVITCNVPSLRKIIPSDKSLRKEFGGPRGRHYAMQCSCLDLAFTAGKRTFNTQDCSKNSGFDSNC